MLTDVSWPSSMETRTGALGLICRDVADVVITAGGDACADEAGALLDEASPVACRPFATGEPLPDVVLPVHALSTISAVIEAAPPISAARRGAVRLA
jgi:hypothetical protein